ncbi:MAG: hypothetical protein IPP48_13175 [Chitinophagaceae bacterium]|nr:hypothetical protein [Chitinophagaceae bacterium]
MKKILLSFIALGLFISAFSQNEYKKRPSLGVHFLLNDFKTASDVRTIGLANVIKSKLWHNTSRMSAGLALSYLQGLSNHVDFAGTLSGSFLSYPVPGKPASSSTNFC